MKSSSDVYLCKDRTYYLYNYGKYCVSDEFSRKITDDNSITSPVIDEETQVIYLQDEIGSVIEFVKAQED